MRGDPYSVLGRGIIACAAAVIGAAVHPMGAFADSFTATYAFTGGEDGGAPVANVVLDAAGNLYGETSSGGDLCAPSLLNEGCGTVFRLDPSGHITTLVTFRGANGAEGAGNLTLVGDTLYGSALYSTFPRDGLLFSVHTDGTSFTVLHHFAYADGSFPTARPIVLPNGALYDVSAQGGSTYVKFFDLGLGVLFRLGPDGTDTILHNFTGKADGQNPDSIVADRNGTLYGATSFGGTLPGGGNCSGTVYSFVPETGVFTVLHTFTDGADGSMPIVAGISADGTIYGVTGGGGANHAGTIFAFRDTASGFRLKTLWNFGNSAAGGFPESAPYVSPDGVLTGTSDIGGGGTTGEGILYRYDDGSLSILHSFFAETASSPILPSGTPAVGADGTIYGATSEGGVAPCRNSAGMVISPIGCGVTFTYRTTASGAR